VTARAPQAHEAIDDAWHARSVEEVLGHFGVGHDGLSRDEAASRLTTEGPNELEEVPPPSGIVTFLAQFRSPLIFILVIAAVVTAALDEWIDTWVIVAVLLINAVIGFTQERKAERSVRALQSLVSPQAKVVRNGHERQLASRDVVPGDVVVLESGARVPADLRLVHIVGLRIDESLLTGESVPVGKDTAPLDERLPLGDRVNMAFAGSMVTSGRGRGVAVGTGARSQLGTIAERMRSERAPKSPLQIRMDRLAQVIGVVIGIASVATFAIGIALGEPVAEMFRFAVAMAVSAIPEGLPIVLTITLAVGVRRMAQRNAIVRRLAAVETLGSTTVIGSDKTGTLTENRMTVMEIHAGGEQWTLEGPGEPEPGDAARAAARGEDHPLRRTLLAGILANEAEVYATDDDELGTEGDPTEVALLVAAWRLGLDPEQERDLHDLVAQVPFESERRYAATFHRVGDRRLVFVKGAPERIASMCTHQLDPGGRVAFDDDARRDAEQAMAARGLRVLAMAEGEVASGHDLAEPDAVVEAGGLTFLGLQGMLDPPRRGVPEAVEGCRRAGIRPLMITGDHALTARAIASRIGIADDSAPVLTGVELDDLDDEQLAREVERVSVFARVSPDHKLRIVQAARANGAVVAVTGDGVNDAPALRVADIGVAMGEGGTDVAREAADIVLADDNFTSIYAAVHEGRVTFDNVRKVTFFLLSTGAASIVALLTALSLRWPLLVLPTQLLWLNLVTNGVQDVAMAFEPAEPGVLERSPRHPREGVMSRLLWQRTAIVGFVIAAGTLVTFRLTLDDTDDVGAARTVALTTMVLFQMFHLGNARSEHRSAFTISPLSNPFLLGAAVAAVGIHAAALYLPPTQYVLHVEPLSTEQWVLCVTVAVTILVAVEAHKALVYLRERAVGARREAPR
jgi:Ca2+-transporting ATPase